MKCLGYMINGSKTALFIMFVMFGCKTIKAQTMKSNYIYLNAAIWPQVTINYERNIVDITNNLSLRLRGGVGVGYYATSGSAGEFGPEFIGTMNVLFGNRLNTEINLGVSHVEGFTTNRTRPYLSAGYRYNPSQKFVFRVGGGLPEIVYGSVGYVFN